MYNEDITNSPLLWVHGYAVRLVKRVFDECPRVVSSGLRHPDPVVEGVGPVEIVGEPVVRQAVHF